MDACLVLDGWGYPPVPVTMDPENPRGQARALLLAIRQANSAWRQPVTFCHRRG